MRWEKKIERICKFLRKVFLDRMKISILLNKEDSFFASKTTEKGAINGRKRGLKAKANLEQQKGGEKS